MIVVLKEVVIILKNELQTLMRRGGLVEGLSPNLFYLGGTSGSRET